MNEELKPCPFCGFPMVAAQEIDYANSENTYYIGCPQCGGTGGEYVDADTATAAWNLRAAEETAELRTHVAVLKTLLAEQTKQANAALKLWESVPWDAINDSYLALDYYCAEGAVDQEQHDSRETLSEWIDAHAPKEAAE